MFRKLSPLSMKSSQFFVIVWISLWIHNIHNRIYHQHWDGSHPHCATFQPWWGSIHFGPEKSPQGEGIGDGTSLGCYWDQVSVSDGIFWVQKMGGLQSADLARHFRCLKMGHFPPIHGTFFTVKNEVSARWYDPILRFNWHNTPVCILLGESLRFHKKKNPYYLTIKDGNWETSHSVWGLPVMFDDMADHHWAS